MNQQQRDRYLSLKTQLEIALSTKLYPTGGYYHGYARDDDDADFYADRNAPYLIANLISLGFKPAAQDQYELRGQWVVYRKQGIDVWIYNYPVEWVIELHDVMKQLYGEEFGAYSHRERQRRYDLVFKLLLKNKGSRP